MAFLIKKYFLYMQVFAGLLHMTGYTIGCFKNIFFLYLIQIKEFVILFAKLYSRKHTFSLHLIWKYINSAKVSFRIKRYFENSKLSFVLCLKNELLHEPTGLTFRFFYMRFEVNMGICDSTFVSYSNITFHFYILRPV